jgi:cystathionine beta-lyase
VRNAHAIAFMPSVVEGGGMSETTLAVEDLELLRERRSAKWRAYPPDVLPLPVAEMDFSLAPAIREVLHDAVSRSDTGYGFAGPELGESLAGFAADRWGWAVDPTAVLAVPDVGVGCVELLRVLCEPGDALVINTPVYPPFFSWAAETGLRIVEVPLQHDPQAADVASGGWRLDLDGLAAAFAAGARTYLLCNPHNPVGRVHSAEELAAVVDLAAQHGARVISDEIHAPLVLAGSAFTPFLTLPGADQLGVSLVSASKAFNLAGLKCAQAVTGSPAMAAAVARIPVDVQWRFGHLGMLATVAAYRDGAGWLDALLSTLAQRHDLLGRLLTQRLPQVRRQAPEATFLAWLDCTALGEGASPQQRFLERGRVALHPGPDFGSAGSGWVRLNVATSEQILHEAVERMTRALA